MWPEIKYSEMQVIIITIAMSQIITAENDLHASKVSAQGSTDNAILKIRLRDYTKKLGHTASIKIISKVIN